MNASNSPAAPVDNSAMPPVKVGIVGYGWWGKTLAGYLAQSTQMQVVAVVEESAAVRATMVGDPLAAHFAVLDNFADFLAFEGLEAVILCTPHPQHAAQIVAAANAKLHVFCEKPLCLTLADAQRAIAACATNDRVLGIGHERRFEPTVIALRADIAAGKLGTILQIEGNFNQDKFFKLPKDNWRLSNETAPVGPLTATGIHLVDLAIAVLGPAHTVWANLATRGSDFANGDTLAMMLAFPGGANAMISAVLATPFDGRFAVYGTKGWFEIRDRTHPESPSGWDITRVLSGQAAEKWFAPAHPAVLDNLHAFAQAVRGVAPYPVRPAEMLANVAALEAIMRSAKSRALEPIAQAD